MYTNRRIDRAYEHTLVAEWQEQYVKNATFEQPRALAFRREPDTAWPPPSHEHAAIPPQRELDRLKTVLRGSVGNKERARAAAAGGELDITGRRLFADPLPTYDFD